MTSVSNLFADEAQPLMDVRTETPMGGGDSNRPFFYLCGPMSDLPEFNFPLFKTVAGKLRNRDYNVVNPAEFDTEAERRWADEYGDDETHNQFLYRECLRSDLQVILDRNCAGLVCLPGWERSYGARAVETYNAEWLGIPLYLYQEDDAGDPILVQFNRSEVVS